MPNVTLDGRTEPSLSCPLGKADIIYWSDELVAVVIDSVRGL